MSREPSPVQYVAGAMCDLRFPGSIDGRCCLRVAGGLPGLLVRRALGPFEGVARSDGVWGPNREYVGFGPGGQTVVTLGLTPVQSGLQAERIET